MDTHILSDLRVDDPIEMDANYRFGPSDRKYIDGQIRGTEQHIVDSLVNGVTATFVLLDSGSVAVALGDCVCLASHTGATRPTVTKALTTPLSNAKSVFGVVLAAAAPGSVVRVARSGILSPVITGLAATSGMVRVNPSTGRLQRAGSLSAGDYGIGSVDSTGWMSVLPGVSAAGGSADTLTAGDDNKAHVDATEVSFDGFPGILDIDSKASIYTTADDTPVPLTLYTQTGVERRQTDVIVTALNITGTKGGVWKIPLHTKRSGGTSAEVSGGTDPAPDAGNTAGLDASLSLSGDDLQLTITGLTAEDFAWGIEIRTQRQGFFT